MAHDETLAILFPGQGSQTPDMRDQVERDRPDLIELAREEVGNDHFGRADDGTRWAQAMGEALEPLFDGDGSLVGLDFDASVAWPA